MFREVPMSRPSFFLWISLLALVASIGLACGSGSYKIQSITVSPATADAQNYPNGQVPFVATGYYNLAPATVTPLQANWGAALGSLPADGVVAVDFMYPGPYITFVPALPRVPIAGSANAAGLK